MPLDLPIDQFVVLTRERPDADPVIAHVVQPRANADQEDLFRSAWRLASTKPGVEVRVALRRPNGHVCLWSTPDMDSFETVTPESLSAPPNPLDVPARQVSQDLVAAHVLGGLAAKGASLEEAIPEADRWAAAFMKRRR